MRHAALPSTNSPTHHFTSTIICRRDNCKCHCKCLHVGQDESVYKSNVYPSRYWVIDGVGRPQIDKNQGLGVMVSTFVSLQGFAQDLSPDDRAKVNTFRVNKGLPELAVNDNPFCAFLNIGKSYEGYWNGELMVEQVRLVAICFFGTLFFGTPSDG